MLLDAGPEATTLHPVKRWWIWGLLILTAPGLVRADSGPVALEPQTARFARDSQTLASWEWEYILECSDTRVDLRKTVNPLYASCRRVAFENHPKNSR
jgi:hypothetical protein